MGLAQQFSEAPTISTVEPSIASVKTDESEILTKAQILQFVFAVLVSLICATIVSSFSQNFDGVSSLQQDWLTRINAANPELLVIGNSITDGGVDEGILQRELGLRTFKVAPGGTASAWWFTFIKNIVARAQNKPKYLVIIDRDSFITEPTFRVTGKYFDSMVPIMDKEEPLLDQLAFGPQLGISRSFLFSNFSLYRNRSRLKSEFEKRVKQKLSFLFSTYPSLAENLIQQRFGEKFLNKGMLYKAVESAEGRKSDCGLNFEACVEKSLLPHIISTLESNNIQLILVRSRTAHATEAHGIDPPELSAYIADLTRYLNEHSVPFIDFTPNNEFTISMYRGDHYNSVGRELLTNSLVRLLRPITQSSSQTSK